LTELGKDAVVRPHRAHLRKCRQVGWPLKLLEAIDGNTAAVDLVIELLEAEVARRDFKPDRKVDLLSWLSDRKDSRAVAAAAPLLTDFDEGVRCAAVAAITAQADDRGRAALEPRLVDPKEESNRLKARIATVFAQRRWKVEDAPGVQAALPPGFQLRDGVVLAT
jgi:HEAT repeat protein